MNYIDFVWKLKSIAIDNRFRVFMDAPDAGSGFFFHFKDVQSGKRSGYICWDDCRETPDRLFDRLEEAAKKFKQSLSIEE